MTPDDRRPHAHGRAHHLRERGARAMSALTLRVVRAGDASLSRAGGPLRADGRLTRVLPFGIIALASLVLTLLPTGAADAESAHPEAAVVAAVMFAGIVLAALTLPWDRWPTWTQVLVPVAYVITVMLVVHAQGSNGAGYTVLYVLPVAWVALYAPGWQLAIVGLMSTAFIVLPPVLDGPMLGEDHYRASDYALTVVVLLIILFIASALRVATNAAARDALTGLPNRRVFMAELRRLGSPAAPRGARAVVVLDLDRFKAFNDAHGHDAGDRLLEGTADAWARSVRERDLLARIGGEEFGLIVEGGRDEARTVAERLIHAVPDGQTASAGVACVSSGTDPMMALKAADVALYAAKDGGRARVVVASG